MMDEYVEEYLQIYGFNNNQIEYIKTNPYVSQVTKTHLLNIIKYFEDYKISKEKIIEAMTNNKWIISENYYRINAIEDLFKKLEYSDDEYKYILENNYKVLTINPNEFIKTINYIKTLSKDVNIKKFILKNLDIISEKFLDIKEIIDEKIKNILISD